MLGADHARLVSALRKATRTAPTPAAGVKCQPYQRRGAGRAGWHAWINVVKSHQQAASRPLPRRVLVLRGLPLHHDSARTEIAIRQIKGKRLSYKQPIGAEKP
jgi:hypothetical protein